MDPGLSLEASTAGPTRGGAATDEEEEDPDEPNDGQDPDETDLSNSGGLLELPG